MHEITKLYYKLEGLKELEIELKKELFNTPLQQQINKVERDIAEVSEKLCSRKKDIVKELLIKLGYECRTNHKILPTLYKGKNKDINWNEEPEERYTYVIIHKNKPPLLSIREIQSYEGQDEPYLEGIQTSWEGVKDIYTNYSDTWLERSGLGIVGYGTNESQAWANGIEWLVEEYGIYNSDIVPNIKDSLNADSRLHTILQLLFILPLNLRQRIFNNLIEIYISNNNERDLAKELILTLPQNWVIKELYRIGKDLLIDELYTTKELKNKSIMVEFIEGDKATPIPFTP